MDVPLGRRGGKRETVDVKGVRSEDVDETCDSLV